MSRLALAFHAEDISSLSRSICRQLTELGQTPSHLQMLNILARAAGHRNFQSLRAAATLQPVATTPAPSAASTPAPKAAKATPSLSQQLERYFGADGRMLRWPTKFSHQEPCLWVLWSRLPARRTLSEADVNALLKPQHDFGDHVLLRRELCNYGLLSRTLDGRIYHRVERHPPPEILGLIRHIEARAGATQQD